MKIKVILNDTLQKVGKSQYWLSQETGISAATICNFCNNKTTRVDFHTLELICTALDCDISDILALEKQ